MEVWSELAAGKEQAESSSVETGTPSTTGKNICQLIDLSVKSVQVMSGCGSMKVYPARLTIKKREGECEVMSVLSVKCMTNKSSSKIA